MRCLKTYDNGLARGRARAETFFASSDVGKDRKRLRKRLNRVLDRLHDALAFEFAGQAAVRACRLQGIADGFVGRIAELLGECILDGAQWAQFAANLYCESSLLLGGLRHEGVLGRAPTGLCGTAFEGVCDQAYAYVASEGQTPISPSLERFLLDRGIALQPYVGCALYTQSSFQQVFSASVEADCAFLPISSP